MTPKLKRLMAEVISGLQVPRSLVSVSPMMLGTALEPYDELCHYLRLGGYPDAASVEEAIDRVLEEHE